MTCDGFTGCFYLYRVKTVVFVPIPLVNVLKLLIKFPLVNENDLLLCRYFSWWMYRVVLCKW